jgi:general secretion pathway protein I
VIRTRNSKKGFSLLEVLVATFIMAVAITGLVSNLSGSLRNASRIGDYDRAAILAKRQMDELLVNRALPRWVQINGGWDASLTGSVPVRWRAIVTPFDVPPGAGPNAAVLDRIELQISWENRTFTIEGFRRGYLTGPDAERLAVMQNGQ